jgi:proliferating cell nuclear antigen
MDNSAYLLNIKTVQASTFKQVVDALKEILMDVNLEIDETGIKIVAMDNTHIVLIHLKLDADKFEHFYCDKKIYVGINMLRLHTLIKTITNNDILSLFVLKDDPNSIGITIDNNEKNFKTNYKLSMLDIDVLNIEIPPVDFHTIISMPSSYLQKIIRDMHNLAEFIEFRNIGDKLILSCKSDFCEQETIMGTEKSQNISIKKSREGRDSTETSNDTTDVNDHEIIQGIFSLKYLSIFTKCTNLSNMVEIYLKNSYPIILRYNIASLGNIMLCLAQQDTS